MRLCLLGIISVASACSPATADALHRYDHAIECEVLTGFLGAYHPTISREQVLAFQQGNTHYNRETERLGGGMAKNPAQIDQDRRAYLSKLQEELMSSPGDDVTNAKMSIAESCVDELP